MVCAPPLEWEVSKADPVLGLRFEIYPIKANS